MDAGRDESGSNRHVGRTQKEGWGRQDTNDRLGLDALWKTTNRKRAIAGKCRPARRYDGEGLARRARTRKEAMTEQQLRPLQAGGKDPKRIRKDTWGEAPNEQSVRPCPAA